MSFIFNAIINTIREYLRDMSKRPLEKIEETLDISTLLWMLLYGSFPYPTAQQQVEEQIGNIDRIIEENPEQAKQGFTWLYRIGRLYRLVHVQPLWVNDLLNTAIRYKRVKTINDFGVFSDSYNYHIMTIIPPIRLSDSVKVYDLLRYSARTISHEIFSPSERLTTYDLMTRVIFPVIKPINVEQISLTDIVEKYTSLLTENTFEELIGITDGFNVFSKGKSALSFSDYLSLIDEVISRAISAVKRFSEYLTLSDEIITQIQIWKRLTFDELISVSDGQIQGYPYPEQPEKMYMQYTLTETIQLIEAVTPVIGGWLEGWSYRKSHEIIGSSAGSVGDYQVKIVVHYGSGDDSGEDVYLNGKCRTDFGDIRFTADDGVTELPYWIEEKVDGDYAVFWVKIPYIPASPNSTIIYLYYGNPEATTTSSFSDTMIIPINIIQSPSSVEPDTRVYYEHLENTLTPEEYGNINIEDTSEYYHAWIECSWDFGTTENKAFTIIHREYTMPWPGYGVDASFYLYANGTRFFYRRITYEETDPTFHKTEYIGQYRYIKAHVETTDPAYCIAYFYFQVVYARNYIEPEPSHGAWGSEESI